MSPALFANTLRIAMAALKEKWEKEGRGTIIGSNYAGKRRITYAMFADDTTLLAKSKQALKIMLRDLQAALREVGLNLNADKCKVQCSKTKVCRESMLMVDGIDFPIVCKKEGFKVLGTQCTMDGQFDLEFEKH